MPRAPKPRYGIAEWFGNDITALTPEERQSYGTLAAHQLKSGDLSNALPCPFLSTLIPGAKCNKDSGVCTIRKFSKGDGLTGNPLPEDKIVTLCPFRFLQHVKEGTTLFSWIADVMLDITHPTIVKETPFLRKISNTRRPSETAGEMKEEAEEEIKKAGRIDWILVNPASMKERELEWCAVETQSVYFQGDKMLPEFEAYAAAPNAVLFPIGSRRPDYRSNGPKRLSPQLDVKVPVLRSWGKKVAVVIDGFFYKNMNALDDAYPSARDDKERRENAEVVWFVIDYDQHLRIRPSQVIYSTLDSSRKALNATEPLSKSDFVSSLRKVIDEGKRANKVFKAS